MNTVSLRARLRVDEAGESVAFVRLVDAPEERREKEADDRMEEGTTEEVDDTLCDFSSAFIEKNTV